jgi:hypothetical protein
MRPKVRIWTSGYGGPCEWCGREDHGGPLAVIRKRVPGPRGYTVETDVGECCQPKLVAEFREQAERGEIKFIDARTTGF